MKFISHLILLLAVVSTPALAQQQEPKTVDDFRLQAIEQQRNTAASESAIWYARFMEAARKAAELETKLKDAEKACKPEEKK